MKPFISGAACILLLADCSKNNTEKPPDENTGVVQYLMKMTENSGGAGEASMLVYNAQNRLISMEGNDNTGMRLAYDNNGNVVMAEVWTEDVLSRNYIHYVNGVPDTAVERYFRRADNSLLETQFYRYTVENDRVVRIRMRDSAGQTSPSDIYLRYQGGNLTSLLQVPPASMTDTIVFSEWTYGTKRNPFTGCKTEYYVTPVGPAALFQSANEPLTMRFRIPSTSHDFREKYVYLYDKEGYPVREARVDEGATDSLIIHYEYRR